MREDRPTAAALLEVEDLRVTFAADGGAIEAVRGVSFAVPPGRTVALVGESGSGKSVAAQAILGILPEIGRITGGAVRFADPTSDRRMVDLAPLPNNHPKRRRIRGGDIAIIFQEPMTSLSPLHRIGDQIGESLRQHRGLDREAARARVVEMLNRVGFPDPKRAFSSYPFELSGGLRQRAMIAMALVCGPSLLIADEPTTALDVTIQAQILKLIKDLQAESGMAVLFITHDLGVVANVADEVVVMHRGRVMESGPCRDLLTDPRHPYLKALLNAVPRLATPPGRRLTPIRAIEHAGRGLFGGPGDGIADGKVTRLPGARLLRVEGLSKTFVGRRRGWGLGARPVVPAVRDLGFALRRGETFALVGESGCGKTTVSRIIMRALDPDGGAVAYFGPEGEVDVLSLRGDRLRRFRRKVQYIFQDPYSALNPRMTVGEIVTEPLLIHGLADKGERRERARALLEAVGLEVSHLRRYPHSFSGGQRQRIGIARALALRPELLICDEPVSALDVSVQAQVLNLLKDLQAELGIAYLFISHNLAVVRYVARRVAVMCAGRIVETADTEDLFARPIHPYTKALLAAVPEPDVDRPLDLAHLMAGRASEPAAWPAPFGERETGTPMRMVDMGRNHHVRMSAATAADLREVL